MRRFLALLVVVELLAASVPSTTFAVAFTPGNLAVYRVGTGSSAIAAVGTALFVDEYSPTGTLVQSIAMPTAVSGANRRLVGHGTATSEGLLNLSADNRYLLLTGYDADVGLAAPSGTLASAVNRVVGRIDMNGSVDTSTVLTDLDNGTGTDSGSPRSAISTNGTDIWAVGAEGGVRYTTFGSTAPSVQVNSDTGNLRHIDIFGGQLYVSSMSGSLREGSVGAGTPITSGNTITSLPGLPAPGTTGPTNPSPYQIFMADLSASVAGIDTLYITDDRTDANNGGLYKYSLVDGAWASNGSISGAQTPSVSVMRGLTGAVSGSNVSLFATRNNNQLMSFTDTSGYNGALAGALTLIATAGTNTAFRGIDFVPSVAPPTGGVSGDYNNNGTVDAADYVLWRDGGTLQNDPNPGNPTAQYNFWRSRFGATSGSGSGLGGGAVPEPASAILLVIGLAAFCGRRRVTI